MAERLPFGQITPVAKPLSTYLSARAQSNTPEAARPSAINTQASLSTVQPGNGGNIASQARPGRGFAEVAEALGPFNRALTSAVMTGAQLYATNQIDAGYEEARNQYGRAQLVLQQQQEAAATNAGSQITQLEKVDPVAAILLEDANPWKQIGRRRAIAQIAGGEVDDRLSGALSARFGELAGLPPGSGELMKVRSDETRKIMERFGLSEDMPEVAQYFTPAMNRAWDKFATKHETAYNDQLADSTTAATTAAMGARLQQMAQDGISYNGSVIKMGDPMWSQLAGITLTQELDKQLGMLGGSKRVQALQQIREQLVGSFGQVPGLTDALGFVRGGHAGMDMSQRPTWGASNPLDVLELKNRGNEALLKDDQLKQQGLENQLEELWFAQGMPGSMLPNDPRYPSALLNFRNQSAAAGYRDVDGFMQGRIGALESVTGTIYRPDPIAEEDFLIEIDNLPSSAFQDPATVAQINQRAREMARSQPTAALQGEAYQRYRERIDERRQRAESMDPKVEQQLDSALLQDMALPDAKALQDQSKAGSSNMFDALIQGGANPAAAAASAFGSSKLVAYSNDLRNLYIRNTEVAINEWQAKNPGVALTPATKNRLVSGAIAETRKSKEYADIYARMSGKQPGQVGAATVGTGPSQGTAPGPQVRGAPKASWATLPDTTVKGYAARPVMDGPSLHAELNNVANGRPVSAELYRLASRAGTSTNRYLLEQLRFYPQLDPKGDAQRFLQQQVTKQRQNQTISQANYSTGGMGMLPTAYNPLAPGSWLMRMIMPPAAAATLPTSTGYSGGGGGGALDTSTPSGDVGKFRRAIINKESGGNYTVVNPDSGAIGIGQVMPENVGPWTQKYLGRRLTPQQFRYDKAAQDAVINGRFRDMLADQKAAGYKGEEAIRRAAAVWYSGQAKLWNNTRPQYSNGRRYPSIAEYTQAIWNSYRSY